MKIKGYQISEVLLQSDEMIIAGAIQESLHRRVFLKILPQLASAPDLRRQFEQEAQLLAKLNHPNIVTIHEFNAEHEPAYLVLEYFAGRNLAEFLIENSTITTEQLLSIMRQTVAACAKAHSAGILHRDIKPANLLIDDTGQVKLTDFGLATLLVSAQRRVAGTVGYFAPELALGEVPTQLTDIYALGMTFYTLSVGENPLQGKNLNEALNLAINVEPRPLSELRTDLPGELARLIQRMISKNPHDRIQSCAKIAEYLADIKSPAPAEKPTLQRGPIAFQKRGSEKEPASAAELLDVPTRKDWLLGLAFFALLVLAIYSWSVSKRPDFVEPYVKYIPDTTSIDSLQKKTSTNLKMQSEDTLKEQGQIPETLAGNFVAAVPVKQLHPPVDDIIADPPKPKFGELLVAAIPWANIVIDSTTLGITPITEKLLLGVGAHTVHFMHPDYPEITKEVSVQDGKTDSVLLNWRTELGFLSIDVYPWAEVYLNSNHIDVTPLEKSIALQPGEYQLLLKNPNYSPWHRFVTVAAGDTQKITVRLVNSNTP